MSITLPTQRGSHPAGSTEPMPCRRFSWRHLWRRRGFPCMVWHQIRGELLGVFAGGGRHRQPATRQLPQPVARPPEHTAGGGA